MSCRINNYERLIMNEFWHSDRPLTSVELFERLSDYFNHKTQIHRYLNQLEDKGLIEVCGINSRDEKYAKYAREFKPVISEEEFTKRVLFEEVNDRKTLHKIAIALLKEDSAEGSSRKRHNEEQQELIDELERIIEEYKKADE